MVTDALSNRTMSAYPLSVGTSLAFESIFETTNLSIDPLRIIPQKVNIAAYSEFWINVSTLFRNMMGSLGKEQSLRVNSTDLKDALINEIDVIQSLIQNEGGSRIKPVFYVCEYEKLQSKQSKYVVLRQDTTVGQKINTALRNQAIKMLLKELGTSDNLRVYDSELGTLNKDVSGALQLKTNALILSHVPYDLTSYDQFTKLDLIESHTGVLKTRAQWHTKYLDGKNLPMIPFLKGLMPVFGDTETFRPIDIKARQDVIALAKEFKWSALTTRDKVIFNLDFMKNKYLALIIKDMFK